MTFHQFNPWKICFSMILFGIILTSSGQTYVQQGSVITGTQGDALGFPVSSSSSGDIIAVSSTSAPGNGDNIGNVKIYEYISNAWTQMGSTLNGEAIGDSYGLGLSLSGDGTILAVGAPFNVSGFGEFSNAGRVYLYEWNGTSWAGIDTLDASAASDNFGNSLSLSENGAVLAVGAPGANGGGSSKGAARLYVRSGNDWIQKGSDIVGVQDFENFGAAVSVAVTETDSVLAISAIQNSSVPGSFDEAGKVHIYRSSTGQWAGTWNTTDSINGTPNDYFGFSVDLSSDGSRLIVGAPQSFLNPGNAYSQVYEFGTEWTAIADPISSQLIGDELGRSVAISGDGTHIIVGAPTFVTTENPNGYFKFFKLDNAAWVMQDSVAGDASEDAFGTSVDINSNGTKYIAGAPNNDAAAVDAGQVKAYQLFTDTTPPTIALSASNDTTNQSPYTITITFSEQVTGFDLTAISGSNGTIDNLTTSDSIVFTADVSFASEGPNVVSIGQGAVSDLAGNVNSASAEYTIVYDITSPSTQIDANITSTSGTSSFSTIIGFSEKVVGFEIADIIVANATASNFQYLGETFGIFGYSVDITPDGNGDITMDVAAGVARDIAGNDNLAAQQYLVSYDNSVPSVTISSTENDPTNANPLLVQVTFTEEVTGFAIDDLTIDNGSVSDLSTSDNIVYEALIVPETDGTVTVDIAAGVVQDLGGNNNTAASQFSIDVDITRPTVAFSITGNDTTNLSPIPVTITFSEKVSGFALADISSTNSQLSNLLTTDSIVFSVDITPADTGAITLNIAENIATDAVGNSNLPTTELYLYYDNIAPAVAISQTPQGINSVDNFNGVINFGETVTGFQASDIQVTNGTVASIAGFGNESIFLIAITPTGDGNITFSVPAGVAQDIAGNTNLASDEIIVLYDTESPTITVNTLETNDNTPTITGTIDDAEATISVNFLSGSVNVTYTGTNNGDNTWTLDGESITAPLPDGSYTIDAEAEDPSGNTASDFKVSALLIDTQKPTLSLESPQNGIKKETVNVTFNFSEEVSGFRMDDLNISNGIVENLDSIDATTYRLDVTANTDLIFGDNVSITIRENAVFDGVNNGNAESTQTITYTFKYSGGSGTQADPYLIGNPADLRSISGYTEDYKSFFTQIADIEIGSEELTPIGNRLNRFSGNYDGKGYSIDGITNLAAVASKANNETGAALFGHTQNATLSNIGITSLNLTYNSGVSMIGGLVAYSESTIIENCFVTGSITTNQDYIFIGGLVSVGFSTTVRSSFTDVSIYDNNAYAIGGIMGSASSGSEIRNSYSLSDLTIYNPSQTDAIDNIYGGLIGEVILAFPAVIVDKSYFAGEIATQTIDIGGIVAKRKGGSLNVTNSFWDTEVSGLEKTAGSGTGLVSDQMRNKTNYTNAGWDFDDESTNGTDNVWTYPFGYPLLSWQLERNNQPYSISGKVVNENGDTFTAGSVDAVRFFPTYSKTSAELNSSGEFSLDLPEGAHLLSVTPTAADAYFVTYYGNTNLPGKSKVVRYNTSGLTIQMIAKSQENLLDGNGRVNGRVIKAASGARITQGRILQGEPLVGVTVYLIRVSDGQIMTSVVTDDNGDFEISGIPAGEYQLALEVTGVDANLEGSTFTMDEEGTPLEVSAAIGDEGVSYVIEEVLGVIDQIDLSVYPNPASEYVNVNTQGASTLRIIDLNGSVVINKSFDNSTEVDISTLKNGIYLLEVQSGNGTAMRKLIKR